MKLEAGKRYKIGPKGHKTRVLGTIAIDDFDNLLVVTRDGSQRVDDLSMDDLVFEPVGADEAKQMEYGDRREYLQALEDRINAARESLDELEREACQALGCEVGDSSMRSDAVLRFVRDGYGMLTVYAECERDVVAV